jgi:hypothetical protein
MRALIALTFAVFAAACGAPTHQQATQEAHATSSLAVQDQWAAPMPDGVDVGAGYLTIANRTDADDRLLSATSPRAARVEIHEMTMEGAVMQMRAIDDLEVPAGQDVTLGPGGMHLMFFGVTQPFAEGEEIPLVLTFEDAGAINVALPVRRAAAQDHAGH